MMHAANTVNHIVTNDDKSFNQEMAMANKKAVLLVKRFIEFCGLHIG
jgi:acyl CoA:acetate/3-ketoacid CoA transferase alpha subunit